MGIEVREVRIENYAAKAVDLIRANWAETGFDFEAAPDFARYQAIQDAGALLTLAAFDGDTVVGYSTAYLSAHMFNPAVVCCLSEALFVADSHRKGSAPYKLIRATEQLAKARGAHRMMWCTRAGTAFAEMLKRRGYADADVTVMKGL